LQIWIVQRRANSSPFLDNELQPNCEKLGKIQARTYNDAWKIWERMNEASEFTNVRVLNRG